ncbi:MAG: hypothetical protein ABI600_05530 [Luteolibacter sp.]
MKLHPEDPRLTSYLLGELGNEEAAAVELAAATDPAVQTALAELNAIQKSLSHTLAPVPNKLLSSQRASVLQAARQADLTGKTVPYEAHHRNRKPWFISLAAAAAVMIAAIFTTRAPAPKASSASNPVSPAEPLAPVRQEESVAPPPPPALPPAVAAVVPAASPVTDVQAPVMSSRGFVTAADSPSLELPVLSGKPNLDGITQAIRIERKLPVRERVRLEEILNCFPIRLSGVTAIARTQKQTWHPDNRDEGISSHTATLAAETLPCPWKPSATLLLISIRGNATNDCDAKVVFHPSPTAVFHYRLLGFTPNDDSPTVATTKLAAGSATTLAIEVEPSTATGNLGTISWRVNDEPAAGITITRTGDNEPSNDARFASLVCAYSQWLAGEQAGMIDPDLLSALAREIDSVDLSADRADFLKLVEESLRL